MKFTTILLGCFLLIPFSKNSFAHGAGGGTPKTEVKKPEARHAAHHPAVLDEDELSKFMAEKKMAEDVVAIHCKLSEFTNCRGMEVSLYDLNGKLIGMAHTGMSGIVGFEGLRSKTNYVAKIENEKYRGETQVQTGTVFGLMGEKK